MRPGAIVGLALFSACSTSTRAPLSNQQCQPPVVVESVNRTCRDGQLLTSQLLSAQRVLALQDVRWTLGNARDEVASCYQIYEMADVDERRVRATLGIAPNGSVAFAQVEARDHRFAACLCDVLAGLEYEVGARGGHITIEDPIVVANQSMPTAEVAAAY